MSPSGRRRNWGCRISDELAVSGIPAVVLENELLRVTILTGKGTDVVELLHKPTDTDFMWRSPHEPGAAVTPAGAGPADAAFHDRYLGGWHEMLPTFGASTLHGAEFGICGEVTLLPWRSSVESDEPDEVAARFEVRTRRLPLRLEKRVALRAGTPALFVEERLVNEGGHAVRVAWGHHPVLGGGFLREGCVIDAAAERVVSAGPGGDGGVFRAGDSGEWPRLEDADGALQDVSRVRGYVAGWEEDVVLPDVREPWVAVTDPERGIGFGLAWTPEVFRHLWLWQNFGGREDYPWYGRAYGLGLEFLSSLPFDTAAAARAGELLCLEPGAHLDAAATAVVYRGSARPTHVGLDGSTTFDRS